MHKAKDILRVLPNPFLFGGDPICSVETDRAEHTRGLPNRSWVGLRPIVTERGEAVKIGSYTGTIGGEQHDVDWDLSEADKPVEIPNTSYYRQMLKERSLVPADAETAAKARVALTKPDRNPNAAPEVVPVTKQTKKAE